MFKITSDEKINEIIEEEFADDLKKINLLNYLDEKMIRNYCQNGGIIDKSVLNTDLFFLYYPKKFDIREKNKIEFGEFIKDYFIDFIIIKKIINKYLDGKQIDYFNNLNFEKIFKTYDEEVIKQLFKEDNVDYFIREKNDFTTIVFLDIGITSIEIVKINNHLKNLIDVKSDIEKYLNSALFIDYPDIRSLNIYLENNFENIKKIVMNNE